MRDRFGEIGAKLSKLYLYVLAIGLVVAVAQAVWAWASHPSIAPTLIIGIGAPVSIIVIIALLGGAVAAWRTALIFGTIGGFSGGAWGCVAGVAIAGAFGAIQLGMKRSRGFGISAAM